jgi:hypothetical protein
VAPQTIQDAQWKKAKVPLDTGERVLRVIKGVCFSFFSTCLNQWPCHCLAGEPPDCQDWQRFLPTGEDKLYVDFKEVGSGLFSISN